MGTQSREDMLEARRLLLAHMRERARLAGEFQGQYGKWLVASLLLVHGAVFGFLATKDNLSQIYLPHVFWWPVTGLLLAMGCGFLSWVNWGLHLLHNLAADVTTMHDLEREWPRYDPLVERWLRPTFWLVIVCGVGSAACIVGSAVAAYLNMPTQSG